MWQGLSGFIKKFKSTEHQKIQKGAIHSRLHYLTHFYLYGFLFITAVCVIERFLFVLIHYPLTSISFIDLLYALFYGLRFDMALAATSAWFLSVFLTAIMRLKTRQNTATASLVKNIFMIWVLVLQLIHMGDSTYFAEANRHLGYEFMALFTETGDLGVYFFTEYYHFLIIQLVLFVLLYKINNALFIRYNTFHVYVNSIHNENAQVKAAKNASAQNRATVVMSRLKQNPEIRIILLLVVSVIIVRGGLQAVPMSPLSAAAAMKSPEKTAMALNGVYSAFFSIFQESDKTYDVNSGLKNEEKIAILKSLYAHRLNAFNSKKNANASGGFAEANFKAEPSGNLKQPNVVMIFLESWASYKMERPDNLEVTPFFNKLKKSSLVVRDMYAGASRTTEGIYATLCSAQNPINASIPRSRLFQYEYKCLPRVLKEYGYHNVFFQGTFHNTIGTGDFVLMLGFGESYGKEDVTEEKYERNSWGVHDSDLYNFVLQKMETMPRPFFVGVNTATTHDNTLPPGVKPYSDDVFENVLHFADSGLEEFITKARKNPKFENTIFVILADHTKMVRQSSVIQYNIPFQIYYPEGLQPVKINRAASQRDVAPTVMDLLRYPIPVWFSGKSLLKNNEEPYFVEFYNNGFINWISGDNLVEIPIKQTVKMRCFQYRNDILLQKPVNCGANFLQMRKQALVFTEYYQGIVNTGRTMAFEQFEQNVLKSSH